MTDPVKAWDARRWPNFTVEEVACKCCHESYIDEKALDALQKMRKLLGEPLIILSGHRCKEHNEIIGGAANSQHLKLAFDISTAGHNRARMYDTATRAGFAGFGFMENGLHVDVRDHPAHWDYGQISRARWAGIMPEGGGTFERHAQGEG